MAEEAPNITPAEGETPTVEEDTTILTGENDKPPVEDDKNLSEGDKPPEGDVAGENSNEAPENYADFTMPEGVELDEAVLGEATPLLKEIGANQEQAQKLISWYAEQVKANIQSQVEAFNQQKSDWLDSAKSDKEFGGDKFEETVGLARSAIDRFGSDGLKEVLNDYGVGNHPEVIRFMAKVERLTKEDVPGNGDAPQSGKKDHAEVLYPQSA